MNYTKEDINRMLNQEIEYWKDYNPALSSKNIKATIRLCAEFSHKWKQLCDKHTLIAKVNIKFKRPVTWERIRACMWDMRQAGEIDYLFVKTEKTGPYDSGIKIQFSVHEYIHFPPKPKQDQST